MEVSYKSESEVDERDIQPQSKQNSMLHRHFKWLYPWVRSTIVWQPGHLRDRLD